LHKHEYLIVIPIYNLILSKEVNKELKIKDVTFIDRDKLVKTRKKFGFAITFSQIDSMYKQISLKTLNSSKTYAVVKYKLPNKKDLSKPLAKIKESINILASMQLLNRTRVSKFGIYTNVISPKRDLLLYDIGTNTVNLSYKAINVLSYTFEQKFSIIKPYHFFPYILRLLNKDTSINHGWKNDITRAVILAGKSIFSTDLSEAFLSNMIALETLLTSRSDKHKQALKERLTALFHWYFNSENVNWDNDIDHIYQLRCKMVHNGDVSDIRTQDLLMSDKILYNLLLNISISSKQIKSKSDLINISEKLKACETLGCNFTYGLSKGLIVNNNISKASIESYRIEMNWVS